MHSASCFRTLPDHSVTNHTLQVVEALTSVKQICATFAYLVSCLNVKQICLHSASLCICGACVAVDCCGAMHDRQWLQGITQTRPEAVRTCAVLFIMPCGKFSLHDVMQKMYAATKICGSCSKAIRKMQPAVRLIHSVSS